MDYERAYKEMKARVLEIGRGYVQGVDFSKPRQIAEYIDPELKESEGEKIMKDVVAAVETYGDFSQGRKEEIYAWLKSKGEQKSVEWYFPYGVNETVDKLIAIAECLEMDGDCEFNGYTGTECGKFLRDLARKQVECKPVEWSEDDEDNLNCVIATMREDAQLPSDTVKRLCRWLKSLKDKAQLQSRQDWSEDDEEKFRDVIRLVEQGAPVQSIRNHYTNWLKSLKDRVQPNPKQEWSEEDERMLTRIINEMEAIKFSSSTILEKNIAQEKIDWLKSIKSHWKPSEERMNVLR